MIEEKNQKIVDELYALYLTNQYKDGENFYKVLPTEEDRETYQALIQSKKDKDLKKERNLSTYNLMFL